MVVVARRISDVYIEYYEQCNNLIYNKKYTVVSAPFKLLHFPLYQFRKFTRTHAINTYQSEGKMNCRWNEDELQWWLLSIQSTVINAIQCCRFTIIQGSSPSKPWLRRFVHHRPITDFLSFQPCLGGRNGARGVFGWRQRIGESATCTIISVKDF